MYALSKSWYYNIAEEVRNLTVGRDGDPSGRGGEAMPRIGRGSATWQLHARRRVPGSPRGDLFDRCGTDPDRGIPQRRNLGDHARRRFHVPHRGTCLPNGSGRIQPIRGFGDPKKRRDRDRSVF